MTERKHSWRQRAGIGALALAMAGVLGTGMAFARHPGHHGGPGRHGGFERLAEKLDELGLDAERQAAVDALLDEARDTRRALSREMRAAHEQMRTLLEQDAPDVDAVMAQVDALGALETKAHKQRLQTLLSLRSIVGKERWAELDFGRNERHGFERSGKDGPHPRGGRS